MTEADYFGHLEIWVSRELAGMRRPDLRRMWCDGFIPEAFAMTGDRSRLTGDVWLTFGNERQERWTFAVLLGNEPQTRDEIDWAAVLPTDDVTGWLSLDFPTQHMTLRPSGAFPDREPPTG